MDPFLVRFAKPQSYFDTEDVPVMFYDPNLEAVVLANSAETKLVIDEESIGMRTGTYDTKTVTDPSRDDPTDRSFSRSCSATG